METVHYSGYIFHARHAVSILFDVPLVTLTHEDLISLTSAVLQFMSTSLQKSDNFTALDRNLYLVMPFEAHPEQRSQKSSTAKNNLFMGISKMCSMFMPIAKLFEIPMS